MRVANDIGFSGFVLLLLSLIVGALLSFNVHPKQELQKYDVLQVVDVGENYVETNWSILSKESNGFAIQRKVPGHAWRTIYVGKLKPGERAKGSFKDTPLTPGSLFCYRVTIYSQRLHDISNQVCETTRPGESVVYMKKLPLYLRNVNKYSIAKFAGENGTYECIDPEMRETITEALRRDKFGGNSKELAKALDTSHCSGSHGWGLGDIWEIIKDAGGKIKNTVECAGASAGLVLGCGFEVGGFVSCLHPKMRRQQPTV